MNLEDVDLLLEKETTDFFLYVSGLVDKLGRKMKLSLINKTE
jgi:hypothetical protein